MIACPSCGSENVEGTRFCVKCGTTLPASPAPESWRQSGDLGQQQTQQPGYQSGGYTPPQPPPQSSYPAYNQQQGMYQQPQQPVIGGSQPMHPAIPAVVSLFLPGIGLLFVPNKAGLGIGIFAGYLVLGIIGLVLSLIVIGICVFMLMPLVNIAAAVHSWDESAKTSGGQFQPILFK